MASDLQRRKISIVFTAMDVNGDGFLERTDFEALAERWARVRGGDGADRLRAVMMGWWDVLSSATGQDGDRLVTVDEVLAVADRLDTMLDQVSATAEAMFEEVDADDDGRVSSAEFDRMIQGWTGQDPPAADAFARLDLDGDGLLSKSEFVRNWTEFWAGDDPDAPGNHLFGQP